MKVIGISASPRRHSNTEILLDRALEGAAALGAETEKIILNELGFKPCQECGGCEKSGACIVHDGMDQLYGAMDTADAVIIASPIFFITLSAQAKMMIDRFHCRWVRKNVIKAPLLSRPRMGFFIGVSGSYRKDHFDNARNVVKALFSTLDIGYTGEMFCGGLEKPAVVSQDHKSLSEAFSLCKDLVKI